MGDHTDSLEVTVRLDYLAPGERVFLDSHDAEGRLVRRVRPAGGVVDFERDAHGRVERVRYPDGSVVVFEHDAEGRRLRMTDTRGTTTYRYDSEGRLAAFDPPDAGVVRYTWDAAGRLAGLGTLDGRQVRYGYDTASRLVSVRDDTGVTTYRYDPAKGRLIQRVLSGGIRTDYEYDATDRLTEVVHHDPTGTPILGFRRWLDAEGRTTRVERETPDGVVTTHTDFDAAGRLLEARGSDGRVVQMRYDENGRREFLQIVSVDGKVTETDFAYDRAGRLVQAGDERFEYDLAGNVVARVSPERTVRYGYDFEDRLVWVDDGHRRVDYEVDGDGRRVTRHLDGRTTVSVIDPTGVLGGPLFDLNLGGSGDEAGDVSGFRAYTFGLGRLAVHRGGAADPWRVYLEDETGGHVAAEIAASGRPVVIYDYDPLGGVDTPLDPEETRFLWGGGRFDPATGLLELGGRDYDPRLGVWLGPGPRGRDSEVVDATAPDPASESSFASRRAKALGLDTVAVRSRTGDGTADTGPTHVATQLLAALPERIASPRSPGIGGTSQRREFPALTQLRDGARYRRPVVDKMTPAPTLTLHPEVVSFAQSQTGLIPAGQTLEVDTSTGQPLDFTLAESIPWLQVDTTSGTAAADPAVIALSVDPSGLSAAGSPYTGEIVVTQDDDPSRSRTVSVRLVVDDGETSSELRSFDTNDRLQRLVKPDGGVIDYYYDGSGRLVRIRYPDNSEVRYTYDANGNRATLEDARGTTVYQYDSKNRLVGIFPPGIQGVLYTYDPADNLTRVRYPGGEEAVYTYDADNRLVSATTSTGTTTYTYDPTTGALVGQVLPNGVTTTYVYDADGKLTDVEHRHGSGTLIVAYHYTLDSEGRRTAVAEETPAGTETTLFSYDDLGRLASTTYPSGRAESYSYDEVGRRTALEVQDGANLTVLDYEYDGAGNLVRAGEVLFQYDLNGNLTRRIAPEGITEYSYDPRNRLVGFDNGETQVSYVYDGDGRRVGEVRDGVETQRVNGANGEPLIEASASGMLLHTYHYGIDTLDVANLDGSVDFLLDQGPFSTTPVITGVGGDVTSDCEFDPFGNVLDPDCDDSHQFAGFDLDDTTGLVSVDGNEFDPVTGRFINGQEPPGAAGDPGSTTQNTGTTTGGTSSGQAPLPSVPSPTSVGPALSPSVSNTGQSTQSGSSPTGTQSSFPTIIGLLGSAFGSTSFSGFLATFAGGLAAGLAPVIGAVSGISSLVSGAIFNLGRAAGDLATDLVGTLGRGILSVFGFDFPTSFSDGISGAFSGFFDTVGNIFSGIFDGIASIFGNLGGVSLNKTADLMLDVNAIAGATYDPDTGQLILFGEEDIALPPLELEDMAIAVDSIFLGQDPGVSIDPPIQNGQMSVRYEGATQDTNFGAILFEADRVLKILGLGRDNLTGAPVGSSVPGYKNMLTRRLAAGCNSVPDTTRMWFQPKEVRLVRSADGQTMLFDEVSIELLHESKVGDQVVSDPQAAAFVTHFTANYDLFAAEWPILQELERLGKIVAVMKWLDDNDIPVDLSFINNYPIEYFSTPVSTPVVTAQGTASFCTISITGGVTFRPPNEYLADDPVDPVTDTVRDAVLAERPSEHDFRWDVDPATLGETFAAKVDGTMTAVAHSFARRRKDGAVRLTEVDFDDPVAGSLALRLVRTYDSFSDHPGPLGPGWSVEPSAFRFPAFPRFFTFGPDNLVLELHERLWVRGGSGGGEELYELIGIDGDDLPIYLRSGASDLLRQLADGSYRLFAKGGREWQFGADGLLLAETDANGNEVAYVRDGTGRLHRVEAPDGRAIDLVYDTNGRLEQADGPGGRTFLYGYDVDGRLSQVDDPAGQTRTYGYDADGKLASVVDATGETVFEATYDDYSRSATRRRGSAADFTLDFDLATRRTETLGPLGSRIERFFDDRFRPVAETDALGNRSEIGWDGDFGPDTVVDAQGNTSQRAYDVRGNLVTSIGPEGERTDLYYDYRDRLVALREPEGLGRGYGYDDADNLTEVYRTVVLQFDPDGNLTGFNYDPSDVTSFEYDASGELVATLDAMGQATALGRDALGRLTSLTTPIGRVTTQVYDARSRLVERTENGVPTTFDYDDADNLTAVTVGDATVGFEYDAIGRPTRRTDPDGGMTEVTYDADGNPIEVVDPAGEVTRFSYDALGRRTESEFADGTRRRFDLDVLGRPAAAITELGDSVPRLALAVETLDFGRVAVGEIAQRTVEVYNLSRGPLELTSLTVTSTTSPDAFSVAPAGPVVLGPGGSLEVTVGFAPAGLGQANGTLTVVSDDPSSPLREIALHGEGVVRVQGLVATGETNGIRLGWDPFDPAGEPFLHFNVYRSTQPIYGSVAALSPIDQSLVDPTATDFLDTTAAAGTSYYYAVTAELASLAENTEVDPAGPVAYFTGFDAIGAELALGTGTGETRPALVHNPDTDELLVVYERDNGGQRDVLGRRLANDGTLLAGPFPIADTANDERRPRVAYDPDTGEYLVVYELDFDGDGSNSVVQGQRLGGDGARLGDDFAIGGFVLDETLPEVAYNPTAQLFLVVFELDGNGDGKPDVVGQRVAAGGTMVGPTFFVGNLIVGRTPTIDRDPHLVFHPTTGEWLVVYEADTALDGSDYDVFGTRIDGSGNRVGSLLFLGNTSSDGVYFSDTSAFISHDPTHDQFLVTWQADVSGDGSDFAVFSQTILGDTTTDGLLSDGFVPLADSIDLERRPRQVYNPDTDEHLVVWDVETGVAEGGTTSGVTARRFQLTPSSLLLGATVEVSAGTGTRRFPDLARVPANNTTLVVWEAGAGGALEIRGRFLGNAVAELAVDPLALSFPVGIDTRSLELSNFGDGDLEWLIDPDVPWLAATPDGGLVPDVSIVQVAVDRTGLASGTHHGMLTVTSSGGTATVPVSLVVPNHAPDAPSSPIPGPGVTGWTAPDGGLKPTFAWQGGDPDGDALTYALYLGEDATQVGGLDPATLQAQGLTQPTATLPALAWETVYHWRVVAADGSGASTAGPVWSFTTAIIPAPSLVPQQPDPTNQNRPTLGWQAVPGASGYDIQLAYEPGFAAPWADTGVAGITFTPATDLPEGTVYWRVRARDLAARPGPYSTADTFTIDRTAPGVPTLVPVVPGRTGDPRPELGWSVVSGASAYRLQVATDPEFASPVLDVVTSSTTHEPAVDLPEATLHWRVASRDEVGNESVFTAPGSFVVDLTPPVRVTGLAVARTEMGAVLTWDLFPAPGDFDHFNLYRAESLFSNVSGMTPLDALDDGALVTTTDATAQPGTSYHYALTAVDQAGNEDRTVTAVSLPANQAPDPPSDPLPDPDGDPVSGPDVTLGWQASDPDSASLVYDLYLSTDGTQVSGLDVTVRVAEAQAGATYLASDLPSGVPVFWRVVVFDDLDASTAGPVWSFVIDDAAPIANDDSYTVAEDMPLVVAAPGPLGNDVDADPLEAVLVGDVAHGTLSLAADGAFTYTPVADFHGVDSFTYRAVDGPLQSSLATVTLEVTPVNDAPRVNDNQWTTDEDTPLVVAAPGVLGNDSDPEGDPLTVTLVDTVEHGTLVFGADGDFTYTPAADYFGSDGFTYRASDGSLDSEVATVTFTIAATNDPPSAVGDAFGVDEDTLLTVAAPGVLGNDSDVEGDPLTATVVDPPANAAVFTFNPAGGFTYQGASDFAGSDSFTYVVGDGVGTSEVVTVTLTIAPVNDPPLANDDARTVVDEDQTVVVAAPGVLENDVDVDGDPLVAVLLVGVAHGTLVLSPDGSWTYTPAADFAGVDTFIYKASDGVLESEVATVTVTVAAINDPPTAVGDGFGLAEDTSLVVAPPGVLGNDSDVEGDPLTATVVDTPDHAASFTLAPDGGLTYTPSPDFAGTDTFTYFVSDGLATSEVVTVTLIVEPVNDQPEANPDSYALKEDSILNLSAPGLLVNDIDVDGDPLMAALETGPNNGTATLQSDGTLIYTPANNFNGLDTLTYRVSDGTILSDPVPVMLTVDPVNDAPVARDDQYLVDKGRVLEIDAPGVMDNDSDVENEPLVVNLVEGTSQAKSFTLNEDGSFIYTPVAGFIGTDSFTYFVSDTETDSNVATVQLHVGIAIFIDGFESGDFSSWSTAVGGAVP